MISAFLKKARKAFWVMGQPLTKKPANPKSVVSDLFVWRCGQDWNTYFELLDLAIMSSIRLLLYFLMMLAMNFINSQLS